MPLRSVPPPVLKFIAERIDTVVELEALLILSQDRDHAWTAEELAARLYTQASQSKKVLEALTRRQLAVAEDDPPRFRFNSGNDENVRRVTELEEAYRTCLVEISRYIHSKASVSVKEFARAFDLKKDQ